jgi:DNA-binding CsgD family transcriptional regulator
MHSQFNVDSIIFTNMDSRQDNTNVMDAIASLTQCQTESEALTLTTTIVHQLGGTSFVYVTLLPPESPLSEESYRYLIGCDPAWCNTYCKHMWMMNDPFLAYARTHSAPIVGSKIKRSTPGQHTMLNTASDYGFRSGLIVPTHTCMDADKRLGLLYIGSDLVPESGESLLLQHRVQFGALGIELLLWWNRRLEQQAMRKFSLIEEELELLELLKTGKVANEIAAILDLKTTAVYRKLNTIKEKFNVDKIHDAIVMAMAAGLLV